jgi:hypothetical protein
MFVKGALSTFENNLFIGSQQPATANNITTVGGVLIGGKLRVQGDAIETKKIKIIGSALTDGIEIVNIENQMIAKFYNDFKIDLNGPTSILDNLYCSHKIDCYLFTPTEIKPRDANPLLI